MVASDLWTFRDDRGQEVRAARTPRRLVAYAQAAAVLAEHGVPVAAVFGSPHDEPGTDPVERETPGLRDVAYLGAGAELTAQGIAGAEPELLVTVTYDGDRLYGIGPDLQKALEPSLPLAALHVGPGTRLADVRHRFAALAGTLGPAHPDAMAGATGQGRRQEQGLDGSMGRLRAAAQAAPHVRVLALSPAGTGQAHVARPAGWPLLGELTLAGVRVLDQPAAGASWATLGWEELAGLEPDVILRDIRANATPDAQLADVAAWQRMRRRALVLPWNPELPFTAEALASFLDTVAGALRRAATP
ncbi:substrate-binding domain-containing protein [Streptomyces reniochalinae]|uniref:ABC transporter substrate-binding protein n=1 Tax=Streptomyces reniochalinae TaxID=2250578 RepID=A0A367ERL3_9ACTN|nr:ABC transporter substrate-binding protein [Streptomyces reniochalinae]RCG20235.1 ABC transporter substrate-binding protein [Streptomyces reniochalinae]